MTESQSDSNLTIRILGYDYSIACPEGERESLLESAEYLSKRMQSIQRRGKTLGVEKVAVMAALNISRDLLELERQVEAGSVDTGTADEAVRERLAQLQVKIDETLDDAV